MKPYDDLIETNRRRIALLEEAGRLLYREWFVYFRFPGHEHIPFTDGLPQGWERRTFDDVCAGWHIGDRQVYPADGHTVLRIKAIQRSAST